MVPPDVFRVWTNPAKWDNHGGRVTIAGDAAHPMAPFRGQGLNNALEDAYRYVKALESYTKGNLSLVEAVNAYDAEVLEPGRKEIEASNKQAYGSHH